MRTKKVLNNETFLERVREYLPDNAAISRIDCAHKACDAISPESLTENTFFLFDAKSVAAFSRAIEEFALEEENGRFLATFQDAEQFEAEHERYLQLAKVLEDVQVIATGKLARKTHRVKYCNDAEAFLGKFRVILYEGIRNRVMFLTEQANNTRAFERKQFTGFYTFDRKVTSQAREDIVDLLGGRCPDLRSFKHLRQVDLVARRLQVEFANESRQLELAIRRLRESKKYQAQHFIEDFDKTLQRLTDLKAHLPDLIGGHQRTK
ncbi:MAG: hypothetical protein JWM68_2931 [Verrucomicrobiales bacterium]|nr:hypothetical protein [Verrucomicrobiales bacterium]